MALLLSLFKAYWAHAAALLVGTSLGFAVAWSIQDLRVTAAEQDFITYKLSIQQQGIAALEHAEQQRQQAELDYRSAKDDLEKQIAAGDAYRRCVAAGKCGVRVVTRDCGAPLRVPPADRIDVSGAYAVSAGPGTATDAPVVGECAITTLMLNQLQDAIENQDGYRH